MKPTRRLIRMMLVPASIALALLALFATTVFVAIRRAAEGEYLTQSSPLLGLGRPSAIPIQERVRQAEQACSSRDEGASEQDWCNIHRRARPQFALTESGNHWKLTVRFRWFLGRSYSFEGDYEPGPFNRE